MNPDQQANLKKAKLAKAADLQKVDDIIQLQLPDVENQITELKDAIKHFATLLGEKDWEINLNGLVEQLAQIDSLKPMILELGETIKQLHLPEFPDKVELSNLDDLKVLVNTNKKDIQSYISKIDSTVLQGVTDSINKLNQKIDTVLVGQDPKQGPKDFAPVRRVREINGVLVYDDTYWGATGGGGASPQGGLLGNLEYDDVVLTSEDANANPQVATIKKDGATVAALAMTYNSSSKLTRIRRTA